VTPVGVAEEGDPLAGDFVDDDELGVVAAGFAGDDGGGGDAEESERTMRREGREQGVRGGMEEPGVGGPEQDGGDGAPGAGAGLAEPAPKKVAMVQAQRVLLLGAAGRYRPAGC
jgi:hypothetical protein